MSDDLTVLLVVGGAVLVTVLVLFGLKKKREWERTKRLFGDSTPDPGGSVVASDWKIGPNGWFGDKSPGVPDVPSVSTMPPGFYFDVPVGEPAAGGNKVDYVGMNHGPLAGRSEIRLRLLLEMEPEHKVYAVPELLTTVSAAEAQAALAAECASPYPASITMFIQREGDNWIGDGKYALYRWRRPMGHLLRGWNQFTVRLERSDGWAGMINEPGTDADFAELLASHCYVGFMFGGNSVGWGHGMRATGPARLTVTEFRID